VQAHYVHQFITYNNIYHIGNELKTEYIFLSRSKAPVVLLPWHLKLEKRISVWTVGTSSLVILKH